MLAQALTGERARFELVDRLIPAVERKALAAPLLPGEGRLLQTHERYRAAYRTAVYVVRDPRDVVLSYHRYEERRRDRRSELDRFVERFRGGDLDGYGPWREHVRSWLRAAEERPAAVQVVSYSDLRADPAAVLGDVLTRLGATVDAARVAAAVRDTSLAEMRAQEAREQGYFEGRGVPRPDVPFVGQGRVDGGSGELERRHLDALADELAVYAAVRRLR